MEMEKTCEFCTALRPVVFCNADAAYLCLSCDAKIHSANALSSRHSRTLVCEWCRYREACIQCSDHRMFMCDVCDRSHHDVSSQHQKRAISSYVGCPSAKDLAALWGFDVSEFGGGINLDNPTQSCLKTGGSSFTSEVDSVTSLFGELSEVGSSIHHTKAFYKGEQKEITCGTLQQMLDLKRLQLSKCGNGTSLIHFPDQADISFHKYNTTSTWKHENNIEHHIKHSLGLGGSDLQQMDIAHENLNAEPFSLPFSQLDHLTSSPVGNPLQDEAFWQYKSPVQSGQLWSQNMQDLGVCEELGCLDDLSVPDVDLTFRNFEELFGGEQDPTGALLDNIDVTCSSMKKDTSLDGSDNGYARTMESAHVDKYVGPPDKACYIPISGYSNHPIRPLYSTSSVSLSRLSAESSGTVHMDSRISRIVFKQEPSCNLTDRESSHSEANINVRTKYKVKKKVRGYEKQVEYASRKARAGVQGRGKGNFMEGEGYECDAINVTQSY